MAKGANEASVRVDVIWTFHYSLKLTPEEVRRTTIAGRDFSAACFEFHALTQLSGEKFDRDAYFIRRAESNHVTMGTPTPQVFLPEDMPARNPDAKAFVLPPSLENRIYPERKKEREAAQKKEAARAA